MGKIFIIYYKVKLGGAEKKDVAVVRANDEIGAIKNITGFLNNCSSMITNFEILLIKEYKGLVFTRNFGHDN